MAVLNIPILRWGQPYTSLETDDVVHFLTGETLARVSQANTGLLGRDMRLAPRARQVLTEIPVAELIGIMKKAADLYLNATLPMGDGEQTPDDFARQQSASTGLPEHMCKANMKKNHFVLSNMDKILDALTRGLDLNILTRGYGVESRGVMVSYQAQAPVLGLVLPSNSPGVHTLWLPVIPMQIGLLLKPGPQEPWTPYRMAAAFFAGRRAQGSDFDLSGRRRYGRRSRAPVESHHDFWRHGDGGALSRRPARSSPRAGLQQDPAGRRRGGPLGEVSRHHGRQRVSQQRTRLHQLLGHLGLAPHAGDRRGSGRAAGAGRAKTARRSASESGGVHGAGRGQGDLEQHRRLPRAGGRPNRGSARPTRAGSAVKASTTSIGCCVPDAPASTSFSSAISSAVFWISTAPVR